MSERQRLEHEGATRRAVQAIQAKKAYDSLTHRQRRFVDEYVKSLRIGDAALAAGYSKSCAATNGSVLLKRPNVAMAVSYALEERSRMARVDAAWVLKRLAMLADFNIKRFIVVIDGKPYYDFAEASDEDWYCIDEITMDALRGQLQHGELLAVDRIKLKTTSRLKALELLGRHTDVQAFREGKDDGATQRVTEVTHKVVRAGDLPPPPKKEGMPSRPPMLKAHVS